MKLGTVLYMPDGNDRFAKKYNISRPKAYYLGGKTLRLLSEFFVVERRAEKLVYHAASSYTHGRNNSTLEAFYNSAMQTLEELNKEQFFQKHKISFKYIDHSGKIPVNLIKSAKRLSENTKNEKKGEVILLLGYSLESDFNQALSKHPRHYNCLRSNLLFPDIDLVIRPKEMKASGGPVYAMSQTQMIILNKLNPEVKKSNLVSLMREYYRLKKYRGTHNSYHQ